MTVAFPVDYDAIRVALVKEVQRVTELTCITYEPETQNAPRPAKPYLTMKIVGVAGKSGDDSALNIPDNMGAPTTKWTRGGQRKVTVDFNCYGCSHEQAYNYLVLWQGSMETELVQANLRKSGIAIWLNGSVMDISALLNTGYEGRAQLEVQYGVASNIVEDMGQIDTVNVNGVATTDQNIDVPVNNLVIAP